MFRVQITGEQAVRNMARSVGEGPDHLRQHLGRAITRAARPTLRDIKRAAQTNPIRGFPTSRRSGRAYRGPSTPKALRARLAAAVHLDLDVGTLSPRAQFTVRTAQVGAGRVPEYIEAGILWRHPVMGNRKAWAGSQGRPFFERNVERNQPLFVRRTNEAVDRVARAIESGA